jgi:hypothetical protein
LPLAFALGDVFYQTAWLGSVELAFYVE